MKKTGFTLVELLVVIAIITILAAILFPVFATAREKARQSNCASNEKQLTLAMLQYSADNDEIFPWIYGSNGALPWQELIYPYVKMNAVYSCPDGGIDLPNFDASKFCANSYTGCTSQQYYNTTYGLNTSSFSANVGLQLSKIAKPDQLIMLADAYKWPTGTLGGGGQVNYYQNFSSRHTGGTNVGFCDGHIKWATTATYHTTLGVPREAYVYKYWLLVHNNE
ncbi:MAG TPA: DUF1559 domain-containing protein [Capsulimonadaceae bacterium]|jgi:prepilin-type N-terminal cleavage/methylation domain-containing protein/prepilin-type processing-associated H-X9-DG protein